MKTMATMGMIAMGMTFGLACGDAARSLLPPDAGAQGPDGGADRPAPRVIEVECAVPPFVEGGSNDVFVEFGAPELSRNQLMAAQVWECGREESDPGVADAPESQCKSVTTRIIDGDAMKIRCGYWTSDGAFYGRSIKVMLAIP